jgi:nuclear transport factor 2 (NTF2) superfamily protein
MHALHLDHDNAMQKVRLAEDACNTRDYPAKSSSGIHDRFTIEESIPIHQRTKRSIAFLSRKWAKELDCRLIKEM